jgi:hypothetical protein
VDDDDDVDAIGIVARGDGAGERAVRLRMKN